MNEPAVVLLIWLVSVVIVIVRLSPPSAPVGFASIAMDRNGNGHRIAVAAAASAAAGAYDDVSSLSLAFSLAAGLNLTQWARAVR